MFMAKEYIILLCCNLAIAIVLSLFHPAFQDLTLLCMLAVAETYVEKKCPINMLWSQIKLPPYDLNDLQITSEFKNRLGTGRFSTCLRGHKSYGLRPASVLWHHRPMSAGHPILHG